MVITDVNLQNFPEFYALFSELMHEGYGHFPEELRAYFLLKDYSRNNLSYWLEHNFRRMLIAIEDNMIQGFIIGDHTYGGVGFISWLGVKKDLRSHGIGTKLLQVYEAYARSKKAHLLELFTSEENKAFYEHHGFYEIGRRKEGFYGQQNLIMNKSLGHFDPALIIPAEK